MKQIAITASIGAILLILLGLGVYFLPKYLAPQQQDNKSVREISPEQPIKETSPSAQPIKDQNYSLLLVLEQDTQIDFGDIKTKELTWNTSEEENTVTDVGLGYDADKLSQEEIQKIENFLLNNGFKIDEANTYQNIRGYVLTNQDENIKTVCLLTENEIIKEATSTQAPKTSIVCSTFSL